MPPASPTVTATRIDADHPAGMSVPTMLVTEEPLEIRLGEQRVATTMRTPENDFELAVGFCKAEGLLDASAVSDVRYWTSGPAVDTHFNVVTVEIDGDQPEITPRLATVSSSCGWCGTDEINEVVERLSHLPVPETVTVDAVRLAAQSIAAQQVLFSDTGGSHAAGDFSLVDGEVAGVREDIGRHNAVDKIIGRRVLAGEPTATGRGLWVSGRASFEMIQKAWAGGFSMVASVSAPSTLAVAAASAAGIALIGFARDDRMTVFNWPAAWPDLVPNATNDGGACR